GSGRRPGLSHGGRLPGRPGIGLDSPPLRSRASGLPERPSGALGCVDLALAPFRDRGSRPPVGVYRVARRESGKGDRKPHVTGALLVVGLVLTALALSAATTGRPWLEAVVLACGVAAVVRAYAHRRAEAAQLASLLAGQTRILEMVATGAPLGEVLDALCRLVEAQVP